MLCRSLFPGPGSLSGPDCRLPSFSPDRAGLVFNKTLVFRPGNRDLVTEHPFKRFKMIYIFFAGE
jgi:hypothetical protein